MNALRKITTLQALIGFIAATIFNLLVNVVSNWVSAGSGWLIASFILILVLCTALWFYIKAQPKRQMVKVTISAPVTLRSDVECQQYSRKGLVAFVSLYRPMRPNKAQTGDSTQYRQLAQQVDYQALDLENSNLEPVIKAAVSHRCALKHCWLITTGGTKGSSVFAPVLEKYLHEQKGLADCQFHYDERFQVLLDEDDTEVVEKTRAMMDRIYDEASKTYGLEEKDMIADITGGPRSLPLGMTLACLDETRDLQFMGTHYDAEGNPSGLVPLIFHFQANLEDTPG